MKFARYLNDTQTPEWKKAYIDYRGLKKKITAIRRWQEGRSPLAESPSSSQTHLPRPSAEINDDQDSTIEEPSSPQALPGPSNHPQTPEKVRWPSEGGKEPERRGRARAATFTSAHAPSNQSAKSSGNQLSRIMSRGSQKTVRGGRQGSKMYSNRDGTMNHPKHPFGGPLSLAALIPLLSPQEASFFTALDAELDKIESFYLDREKEMVALSRRLEEQLAELSDHRRRFYAANSNKKRYGVWSSAIKAPVNAKLKPRIPKHLHMAKTQDPEAKEDTRQSDPEKETVREEANHLASMDGDEDKRKDLPHLRSPLNPDEYQNAKKSLQKAVLEHYRGLETLNNYRILNVTGIRKALKKFEKVTKIPAQHAYMTEKVDTSAFASDTIVRNMQKGMENIYADRFFHGDKKKAMVRLRAGHQHKSHHYSTFRSGICLGLALPAFVSGLYQSLQPHTQEAIPGWQGLLFVYAVLLLPVLFSLLVGVNLLVWSRSRINYVFIFELDIRTRLDHREYFEIPSILLATLCYAFWLSFSRIGAPSASPTIWPLVWLGFTAVVLFEPFPFMFRRSRFWILRNTGRLLISGTRRVEFTDFWLGDQFCSLIFTLSNLYLFCCSYAVGFESWRSCGNTSKNWPVAFALASLPLLVRLVQSVKRYIDSGLFTHMINGGKYGSGIISYLFYFLWRHHGSDRGAIFALWVICNTIYSTYATSWDFLMDWSVLRVHAEHPLLRSELVYTAHIPLYYFAIVTNVLIRFIWIIYIPVQGPDRYLRTVIVGILEMLRRWQWNFYRLENEHLGNMDQYRITREIPLPYTLEDSAHDDGEDDDDVETGKQ